MKGKLLSPFLAAIIALFTLLGCSQSYVKVSPVSLYEASDFYYPINQTQKLLPKWPTREYETDVTIEGIGWKSNHFFVVMKTQVLTAPLGAEDLYSAQSKRFWPEATYNGQNYKLQDLYWEEGSPIIFRNSVYRYAFRLSADSVPQGVIPTAIHVSELTYDLPDHIQKTDGFEGKKLLEAYAGSIPKAIEYDEVRYQMKAMEVREGSAKIEVQVKSEIDNAPENRLFLLRDDKNRVYTVTNDAFSYPKGSSTITLHVNEKLPADIGHLSLILFETNDPVAAMYVIDNEAEIPIF